MYWELMHELDALTKLITWLINNWMSCVQGFRSQPS